MPSPIQGVSKAPPPHRDERLFRAEVLRMLLEKELITEANVDNLLSWRHGGFSAHGAVRVEDRAGAGRLGRYMIRFPVVLKRLSWQRETGEIVYRSRPSHRAGLDGGHARSGGHDRA